MIIPHLIFSHLLADYILQTSWLAARKGQFIAREIHSWDGLALHGLMVWLMSLVVLPRQIAALWPYITILALSPYGNKKEVRLNSCQASHFL